MDRVSWDTYFLDLAGKIAERSTCTRRYVGAIAVKDRRILATGYNGSPMGLPHCTDLEGCIREEMEVPAGQRHELCRATHAEQNIVAQAARFGISLESATIYISGGTPCTICAKLLINVKIKHITCNVGYPDMVALAFLREAGIDCEIGEPA